MNAVEIEEAVSVLAEKEDVSISWVVHRACRKSQQCLISGRAVK